MELHEQESRMAEEFAELARAAAWGLVKGGHLDSLDEVGSATLLLRHDILDAAARAGIHIDTEAEGIGAIYGRDELR